MREAPALVIIEKLLKEKAIIKTHDPVAMHETKRRIGDTVAYCKDIYEALIDADALLILTEWSEFRVPNYVVMSKLMKNKVIFDGRNIYDPTEIKEQGFEYFGIGRS